jgi:hypothetical protein
MDWRKAKLPYSALFHTAPDLSGRPINGLTWCRCGLDIVTDPLPIDYAHRVDRRGWPRFAMGFGIAGCVTGAIAIPFPLWPLWGFYHVPVGTSMRPMGLTAILVIFAVIGLFIALPLSLTCLALGWRERRARWICLMGVLLSLSATFVGFGLFNWIVAVRHFVLED